MSRSSPAPSTSRWSAGSQGALARIEAGDRVIVDGDNGQVFVRPGEDIEQTVGRQHGAARRARRAVFASAARPAGGHPRRRRASRSRINAGLLIDLQHLAASGADGIGLFRTEIAFMVRDSFPDVAAADRVLPPRLRAGRRASPVIFRTLDVGGDKVLPYLAARRRGESGDGLARDPHRRSTGRHLLRQQLRALIAAAAGRPLDVMFPMIAEVAEFDRRAGDLLDLEVERAARSGEIRRARAAASRRHARGAVAALAAAGAAGRGRFRLGRHQRSGPVPVRQRPRQSAPGRPLRPAVARPCCWPSARWRGNAPRRAAPLSVCGEMAGKPLEAMALLGLGFGRLSMSPSAIGPVKLMMRSLEVGPLRNYIGEMLRQPHVSIRHELSAYARDHGVTL